MEGCSTTVPAPRLAAALLALLALASLHAAALAHHHGRKETSPAEFIRSRCNTTEYPRLCISSLSAFAGTIRTSPTQLADAALNVSLSSARSTKALVGQLSAQGKDGMGRRVASVFQDCMETMGDSVDELRESVWEMARLGKSKGKGKGKADLGLQMNNVLTWVSAALTDEDTCMDELAGKGMDGEVKTKLRRHIRKVARLTSNALALINGLSSAINSP